jgi:hypothetical protein
MCFSAEASFAGGVIISSIGVAAVRSVRTSSQIAFAGIPLLFGIQQIAEGALWVSLPHPEYGAVQKIATSVFLLMARVVWPMIIPLSLVLMEENIKKKKVLLMLLGMGVSVSLYYSYCLLFLNVAPQIAGHHIRYVSDFPEELAVPVFVVYFIASITPFFISSVQRMRLMGVLMFFSCLVTAIFFIDYLTSVWCFFAAIISVVIYWMLRDRGFREA